MPNVFVPLSFTTRRAPLVQKVVSDGSRMYEHARHVIVLDSVGKVLESFENPPFGGTVDCLVVLAPCVYRNVYIDKTVVLEIGFRRFVPYAQTEYKYEGNTRRGPKVRTKKGEDKAPIALSVESRTRGYAIKPRIPVIALTDRRMLAILPTLMQSIQLCVDEIIKGWKEHELIQERHVIRDEYYTYHASIFIRFPESTELLCAGARFAEMRYRVSERKNLAANAKILKERCRWFAQCFKRHKTEAGDYLDESVKSSEVAFSIADFLRTRIVYRAHTRQTIATILTLIGPATCEERKLIQQIWRIFKVPTPPDDEKLVLFSRKHRKTKGEILSLWTIENFASPKHDKNRQTHARNALTMRVFGSKVALEAGVERLLNRKERAGKERSEENVPF